MTYERGGIGSCNSGRKRGRRWPPRHRRVRNPLCRSATVGARSLRTLTIRVIRLCGIAGYSRRVSAGIKPSSLPPTPAFGRCKTDERRYRSSPARLPSRNRSPRSLDSAKPMRARRIARTRRADSLTRRGAVSRVFVRNCSGSSDKTAANRFTIRRARARFSRRRARARVYVRVRAAPLFRIAAG